MKYEVTLTLRPYMYSMTAAEQYRTVKPRLFEILKPYKECTCIAELTNEHNVHFHMMIELDSHKHKDKFLNEFRNVKMFGRKSCTQVQFEESYRKYITKEIDKTNLLIGCPVVRDFYGCAGVLF